MRQYVACKKVEDWGPITEAGPEFTCWTVKRSKYIEKTLGQNVWVITSERTGSKTTYKLCYVFTPEKFVRSGAGYILRGKGTGFVPHVDVTGQYWFGKLLDEQENFSRGLNETKDTNVIDALLSFIRVPSSADFPDEVEQHEMYVEGATRAVMVNAYERDRDARAACIAHYGMRCLVCGFDFEAQYGPRGKGVIDVHHLKPLAEVKAGYQVDPVTDLRPVCANCHTIIHRGDPQLSIEEAKTLVQVKYVKDR